MQDFMIYQEELFPDEWQVIVFLTAMADFFSSH